MGVTSVATKDVSRAVDPAARKALGGFARDVSGLGKDALRLTADARKALDVVDTTISDILGGKHVPGTRVRFVGSLQQTSDRVALGDKTMLLNDALVWDRNGHAVPTDFADSTFAGQQNVSARNALNPAARADLLQYGRYVPIEGTVGTTTGGPIVFVNKVEGKDASALRNMTDLSYPLTAPAPVSAPVAPAAAASYVAHSGARVTTLADGSREIQLTSGDAYQVAADGSYRFKPAGQADFGPEQRAQGMAPWAYALLG